MRKIIAVTRKIPDAGLELFTDEYEIRLSKQDRVLKEPELKKLVTGADGIIALLTDKIDASILEAAGKQLKIVANFAVGFDNIDLAAAKKKKIVVTNTPGVLTEAVAEHAIALMLAVSRRIVESDKFTRAGRYEGWEPELLLGPELQGKILGILGLGRIGRRVAEIAALGLGMKVVYYDNGNRNRELEDRKSVV